MNNFIEHLKGKPEHHRRKYAFGLSAGLTAFIFMIWVSVIVPSDVKLAQQSESFEEKKLETQTPLKTFQSGMATVYEGVKNIFSGESSRDIDFEKEYERIKSEVEQGNIEALPRTSPR